MTAIWTEGPDGWRILRPHGFPSEAALHDLIERSPGLLPLSGRPNLAVVGREVSLGGNRADLIAIEPSGRLCIIEVKLAVNSEARRAVIAQVLSYASFLHRMGRDQLENDILAPHLSSRGFMSLTDAARQAGQDGSFDEETFPATLQDALDNGGMRLVLVLDDAPTELVRTVGFLQAVTDALVVDLITVSSYRVGDHQVLVPQRIEPDRYLTEPAPTRKSMLAASTRVGTIAEGATGFRESITSANPEHQASLTRLADWAEGLETAGMVRLQTYWGRRGEVTLLPRLRADNAGLVTIWNWDGAPLLSFWRTVFERRARNAIAAVEAIIAPRGVGQGNTITDIPEALLPALTDAYRTASHH